jgi:hypothetical protein
MNDDPTCRNRHPDSPIGSYGAEADRLGALLDTQLADIRARQQAGQLTPSDAARERIAAMQRHGEAVTAARELYLGDPLPELTYWRTTLAQMARDAIAYQQGSSHPRARGQANIYRKLARDLGIEIEV